jgi:dihydropyrimidinase
MTQVTVIKGGTVCLEDGPVQADIRLEDDRIAAVGEGAATSASAVIVDAAGLWVLPGMMDLHVHLDDRIGPWELADTWATGSAAALVEGITTLGGFVTQRPGETLAAAVDRAAGRAAGRSHCDYFWHLTPTRFDRAGWAEIEAQLRRGFRTFKFYTTYREAGLYTGYDELADILRRLRDTGVRSLVHCEDEAALSEAATAHPATGNARDHAKRRPPMAELAAVLRVIDLAASTGAPVHVVHVSTGAAAAAIARARERAPLTAETAPHYLFLDETLLRRPDGHRWLCTPPLRPSAEASALRRAALVGAVDLFATDHCAYRRDDKEAGARGLAWAPYGVAGVGALVPLVYRAFGECPETAFPAMARTLALRPAQVAGLYPRKGAIRPGADADVVLMDAAGPEQPIRSSLADTWETYPGMTTRLAARAVWRRGRLVVRDGAIVTPDAPGGECLCLR